MTHDEEEHDRMFQMVPVVAVDHREEMAWHAAQADEFRLSIERMFDELSPGHLLTLHKLLHTLRGDSASCMYFAGQTQTILRVVYKMCRTCESVDHETAEHVTATVAAGPSKDETLRETPDYKLSHEQLCMKYNLEHLPDAFEGRGSYRCKSCKQEYKSIGFRQQCGLDCPSCEAPRKLGLEE